MFDIGFFELLMVAIVGLLVIGPERLPGAIRTGALWVTRIKRSVQHTRDEIARQIGADEIQQQLHNEEVMKSLKASKDEVHRTLHDDLIAPTKSLVAAPNKGINQGNTLPPAEDISDVTAAVVEAEAQTDDAQVDDAQANEAEHPPFAPTVSHDGTHQQKNNDTKVDS